MAKILWVSHTSLSISETFIANTLQMLKSSHEVFALSGGSPDLCASPNSGIESIIDLPTKADKCANNWNQKVTSIHTWQSNAHVALSSHN